MIDQLLRPSPMNRPASPVAEPDRVHVLDVLRGMALIGMFFVHFSDNSTGGNAADHVYQQIVSLFFEERFWSMFGILFGVGFAIQLRRADARGASFVPNYLRRLAALAVFGFIAHSAFGYNVLLGYAMWGLPLVLVRRWSVRRLVVALVLSIVSWDLYDVATTVYGVATKGEQAVNADAAALRATNAAFRKANHEAQDATNYGAVFTARLQHMRWFYAQPFSFLPVNNFTLFLLGLLGLRLGIFDNPERHRRLIATMAVFGVASWAVSEWVFPLMRLHNEGPLVRTMLLTQLQFGLDFIRPMWLALTYIGVVLLLVGRSPGWLRRLAPFAWTGRMALTNYMIQIAILDFTFSKYALGLVVTPLVGLTMAVALFVADALCSRWWLRRFRFGPFEWLWRSATYARWQPWRVAPARQVTVEEFVPTGTI